MGFGEIVGHARQLELLRAALANPRLHHAYLFVGPGGIGQTDPTSSERQARGTTRISTARSPTHNTNIGDTDRNRPE